MAAFLQEKLKLWAGDKSPDFQMRVAVPYQADRSGDGRQRAGRRFERSEEDFRLTAERVVERGRADQALAQMVSGRANPTC